MIPMRTEMDFDCGCHYELKIGVYDASGNLVMATKGVPMWSINDILWRLAEGVCPRCDGVEA